jgi:hypothetical protein
MRPDVFHLFCKDRIFELFPRQAIENKAFRIIVVSLRVDRPFSYALKGCTERRVCLLYYLIDSISLSDRGP